MTRSTIEFGRRPPSASRVLLALVPVALLLASRAATPAAALAADLDVDRGSATGNKHARACSLATLKGRYVFADKGTLLPPAFGVTGPTPAADAGFEVCNGDGTGRDTVTLRVNDKVVVHNIVVDTTYTVKPNCTGTITVKEGPTFDIFVAPDGEMFASIATDPGNYPSRIGLRVSSD
jgi:hypothetical protein